MKKLFICLTVWTLSFDAQAQLLNPGFELVRSDGQPSNWRPALFLVVPLDSTCSESGLDSLYFVTNEAHTGNNALEMRVVTYCGNSYGGNIKPIRDDSDSSFFNQSVPFTERPTSFSFYYKLHVLEGDVAKIQIQLDAADGTPISHTNHIITQEANDWILATIPLEYQNNGNPAFLNMQFEIDNDSLMHYGSRFLIDDITFGAATSIHNLSNPFSAKMICYPVPVKDLLFIHIDGKTTDHTVIVRIMDMSGRLALRVVSTLESDNTIHIPVHHLAAGMYLLEVYHDGYYTQEKFIK